MRAGVCAIPSSVIVKVPVGVATLELDPEATVTVMASLAPAMGVVVAAERVVFDTAVVTVKVIDPAEAA